MKLHAYMLAFHRIADDGFTPRLREIEIPEEEIPKDWVHADLANLAYKYGQNDFQPRQLPSVSVGDVIVLPGAMVRVSSFGFEFLPKGTKILDLVLCAS